MSRQDTKILIIHGKHEDEYYDVSTPSQQVAAAWISLEDRWAAGWFGDPREIGEYEREQRERDMALLALTQDDLNKIPQAIRIETLGQIAEAEKRRLEREDETKEYLELKRVVEEKDLSFQVTDGPRGRLVIDSPAWKIFTSRREHEYEGYDIVSVTDPLEALHDA